MPSHRSSTPAPGVSDGIKILAVAVFLVAYGTNLSTPLLVTYRDRLDLGDSATMAIFTVYVVGILAVLPFAGQLSDRHGRQAITIPFVITSAVASLVMVFGQGNLVFLLLGDDSVSRVMESFSKFTARRLNKIHGRTGQFWQHTFHDRMVRDDDELHSQLNYISENPVRAGYVKKAEDWPWCEIYPDW